MGQKSKEKGFSDKAIADAVEYRLKKKFMIGGKKNGIIPVYKMVDTCAAEFESETPYFYGTYEEENESIVTDTVKVSLYLAQDRSALVKELNLIMQLCILYGPLKKQAMKQLLLITIQKRFQLTSVFQIRFTLNR